MAKRPTGVGRQNKTHSPKTKARLEKKRVMLVALMAKKSKHNRPISPGKLRAKLS
jgi:hypothetical protein